MELFVLCFLYFFLGGLLIPTSFTLLSISFATDVTGLNLNKGCWMEDPAGELHH